MEKNEAIVQALPSEFKDRMQQMLKKEYDGFIEALEESDYKGIRRNPLKIEKEEFLKLLSFTEGEGMQQGKNKDGCKLLREKEFPKREIPWCDTGYYYEAGYRPGKHPFHAAGLFYIQEPSAMAVAEYAGVMPGDRVLDLCAAPGGKSTQLAGKMNGEGIIVCNEIHPARAAILSENIERMGIKNALVTNETPRKLAERFPLFFDKIIVDAPCSGEGMFRKNKEALEQWSLENVEMCATRQDDILGDAVKMLRPGGRLVYSTCTFAPQENEGSVERLLSFHKEMKLLTVEKTENMSDGNPCFYNSENQELLKTIRLWPHMVEGEGHFIAVFEKEGAQDELQKVSPTGGFEKGRKLSDFKEARDFIRENLNIIIEDRLILFGEQLYLFPKEMPVLKGMKVVRPGLHLGTMKKNRFEPSHALALSLKKEEAAFSYDVQAESQEIKTYLSGGTLPHQGDKGWYLITVEGYSLGWAKLAGSILKNHYPKGLRQVSIY